MGTPVARFIVMEILSSRREHSGWRQKKKGFGASDCLQKTSGPVIAATDYVRLFAEQIRPFIQQIKRTYTVLGTDGFGRSDTREKLRHFFEVDRYWITVAALKALVDEGSIPAQTVSAALQKYQLDIDKPNPLTV